MQIRRTAVVVCLGLVPLMVPALAQAQYQLTNLVSNQLDQHAANTDPLLVNAWGIARSATSPWWVTDNLSGWSTLYNAAGTPSALRVLIPTAGNGPVEATGANGAGLPTGSRFQWLEDGFPGRDRGVVVYFCHAGRHDQRVAGREQESRDAEGRQIGGQGELHRPGNHQQCLGEFPLRGGQYQQPHRYVRRQL